MKNYYKILEVDKNASAEIIEKAYRTLAKRYHPDLQENRKKIEYEEKMKEINEAYSVLSDDYKKSTYDKQLESTTVTKEEFEMVLQENMVLKEQLKDIINKTQAKNNMQNNNSISNMNRVLKEQINRATSQAYKEAYHDAYINDMQNRGYKIRYKHDLKYYLKAIAFFIVTIFILFIIYQIPVVKNFFTHLYEQNLIFKAIVNIFKNTFTTAF